MTRHLNDIAEMYSGAQRPSKAIALFGDGSRASGTEEIF
jgi:hypothetical protein